MRRLFALLLVLGVAVEAQAAEALFTEGAARREGGRADPPFDLRSFVRLSRTLGPAVVNVIAIQSPEEPPAGGGEARAGKGRGQGTGFLIHKSGYLLTNSHVVERSDDIRVRLSDERELSARLIGRDARTDLALLKVEAGGDLPVAPLGNSDELQIGEWVIAIGNPFGLDHTVTAGIVSAKGRRDIHPGGVQGGYFDFIQTDASINPGNSGGPLINARGEVVGINTAMNAQAQGIGFAIPINIAKVVVPLLRQYGKAPRSWLGITPQPLTSNLRKAFHLPDRGGALVSEVGPDSPASRAGLQSGDVVLAFDGHSVAGPDDLMWLVATAPTDRELALALYRGGVPFRAQVKLETAPEEPARKPPDKPAADHRSALGITVSEVSPTVARQIGKADLRGVVVTSVEVDSPALEAGIETGDLVLQVGDLKVGKLDDYARSVRTAEHGEMLRLLVKRDGQQHWVAFPKR